MSIVYRTDGAWGAGLGVNLSAAQVDNNFWEVVERLVALETGAVASVNQIDSITVIGSQMTIFMEDATTFGPFTIPVAVMHWRDQWAVSTDYDELDLVYVPGRGVYLVRFAHTSDPYDFDPLATNDESELLYFNIFGELISFIDLIDAPDDYTNAACKDVVVNEAGDGIVFEQRVESVTFFRNANYSSDEVILQWRAWRNFILPCADPSVHKVFTDDAASEIQFSVQVNGVEVGTIDWHPADVSSFVPTNAVDLPVLTGDIVSIVAPTFVDTSMLLYGASMLLYYANGDTT